MSVLMSVRQRLLDEDPSIADDEKLFSDMLEGESGDAMNVLDRVLCAAVLADDMAEAIRIRLDVLKARHERFVKRSQALRGAGFAAMDALGMRKREIPELTASIKAAQPAVLITDATALPDEMVKIERKPDKTAIRAALVAGTTVPGAEMSNGLPSIQIRTR